MHIQDVYVYTCIRNKYKHVKGGLLMEYMVDLVSDGTFSRDENVAMPNEEVWACTLPDVQPPLVDEESHLIVVL